MRLGLASGFGLGFGLGFGSRMSGGGGAPLPVPSNNLVALFGDSRTQAATGDYPDSKTVSASGPGSWMLHASGYRAQFARSCNFGVGGDSTTQMLARIAAVEACAAGVVVIPSAGVNDASSAESLTNYPLLVDALTAAGKIVIIGNEMPHTSGTAGSKTNQLARRDYLNSLAFQSSRPNVIVIDTFSPMHDSATSCDFKAGYAPDGLHPATLGNSVLGGVIGAKLAQLFATYTPYNTAPTSAGDTYANPANLLGCLIPGFMMTGTTGLTAGTVQHGADPHVVASSWYFGVSNSGGATVETWKGTDSDGYDCQLIRVSGTPTAGSKAISFQNLTSNATYLNYLTAGDKIYTTARVKVLSGGVGFRGFGIGTQINGNNGSAQNLTVYNFAGTSVDMVPVLPFDAVVCSQIALVHADWPTMVSRSQSSIFNIAYTGGAPVDFTLQISRAGMRRLA